MPYAPVVHAFDPPPTNQAGIVDGWMWPVKDSMCSGVPPACEYRRKVWKQLESALRSMGRRRITGASPQTPKNGLMEHKKRTAHRLRLWAATARPTLAADALLPDCLTWLDRNY